jgi:hypothetical protein
MEHTVAYNLLPSCLISYTTVDMSGSNWLNDWTYIERQIGLKRGIGAKWIHALSIDGFPRWANESPALRGK